MIACIEREKLIIDHTVQDFPEEYGIYPYPKICSACFNKIVDGMEKVDREIAKNIESNTPNPRGCKTRKMEEVKRGTS